MRLLLVRDAAGPGAALRGWLGRGDAVLTEAASIAEAAKRLRESRPHVAIIDSVLPDGSGIGLLEAERPILVATGVVFVAHAAEPEEIVRAMKLGATDFLVEPIGRDRLLQAIHDAAAAANSGAPIIPLDEIEFIMVERALRASGGNQSQAARLLQVTRDQLRYRVKRYREAGRFAEELDAESS